MQSPISNKYELLFIMELYSFYSDQRRDSLMEYSLVFEISLALFLSGDSFIEMFYVRRQINEVSYSFQFM